MSQSFPTSVPSYPDTTGGEVLGSAGGGIGLSRILDDYGLDVAAMATKLGTGSSTPAANTFLIGDGSGSSSWSALTSAQLAARVSDETGTGSLVFGTAPTITLANGTGLTEAGQTLADNTTNDVSTTKHGYVPKAPNDTTKFLKGDASWGVTPYCLNAQLTATGPADSTTYYSDYANQGVTTADRVRTYIPQSGTITKCYLSVVTAGTLGTTETSTLSIRLNNTSDTTVTSSLANDALTIGYSNTALSIAVVAGDYIQLKWVTPAWVTNPTNVEISAFIWIS